MGKRMAAVLFVVVVAGVAHAESIQLGIFLPSDGHWQVYATFLSCESAGLAGFDIDVVAGDGAAITSSTNKSPRFLDADYNYHGFSSYRSDGSLGIGIGASQPTIYTGDNDPDKDALVIQNVGIVPGSAGSVTWEAPVLLASGTYSGDTGYLHVAAEAEFVVLADMSGNDTYVWSGPGNCYTGVVVQPPNLPGETDPSTITVPEPATAIMLFLGTCAIVRRKRAQ